MEIFGWIMIIALAVLGVVAILYFAIPAVIDITKINNYKRKLKVENAKKDATIRAAEQATRNEQIRVKDKNFLDTKLFLNLKKKEIKQAAIENKINELEIKDSEIKEAVEQQVSEENK